MGNKDRNMYKFAVLLSVYNKESARYLDEALSSVWDSQTLKPTQVVLVQDGPLTSMLYEIIESWKEKLGNTLTLVPLSQNGGLAAALNEGLKHCRYDLVARMDTDDVACPKRFELQVEFMVQNPEITVCSGQVEEYSADMQRLLSVRRLPLSHRGIRKFAESRNPISHPCVIFRKQAVMSVGGYPPIYPEDYPLWVLMLNKGYKFNNLPNILLKMRLGDEFMVRRGWRFFQGEIEVFKFMLNIGFLTKARFLLNIFQRGFVRLAPVWVRKVLYRYVR